MHILEHDLDVVVAVPAFVLYLQLSCTVVSSGYVELADLLSRESIEEFLSMAHNLRYRESDRLVHELAISVALDFCPNVSFQAISVSDID